jgi:succinyl-CoA synthetase alpha subunit/RimJ/RimL family protein N-acetyltransferase
MSGSNDTSAPSPGQPVEWDVDVVLSSGRVARVRSIAPSDGEGLKALHSRLSPESRLLRFFTPMPKLPDSMVHRFVNVDNSNRVALVVEIDDDIVAVGRYDRRSNEPDEAEVAFVVDDRFQGEGIGSLLLEHLSVIALQQGITRFMAETLASNDAMLRVFASAGFAVKRSLSGGIFDVSFPIEPTDASDAAREQRDHRATVRSIDRMLRPTSVAVFSDLADGAVPDGVDLMVVDVPPQTLGDVLTECAAHDVGVVVITSDGPDRATMRRLTRFARSHGVRLLGPRSLGVANTDPAIGLYLFADNLVPPNESRLVLSPGTVGVFTHSPELTRDVVEAITERKLGISTAVSAGDKADISGNDMLEYWEDDDTTDVVVFGVESFGNPRRFARLAERVARKKPLIILAPDSPETAALCRRTGVLRADTVSAMAQMASVFALHPDWFHPPPESNVVMPVIGTDRSRAAEAALVARGDGVLDDTACQEVAAAVGLAEWNGPVGERSVVGHQHPRFGPLVEVTAPERAVALAPLTSADLDTLAQGSSALADVLCRVGAAVAHFADLAEIVVELTLHDTPARLSMRAAPNPNGIDQVVRYLT